MQSEKQKYLFCYLRTGGGHLAPARSVAQQIALTHGNTIEPVLVDGLEQAYAFARFLIEDGYRILQSKAKWYFEFIYAINKFSPITSWNIKLASMLIKPTLKKKLIEHKPAKIAIFHFLLIEPIYSILEELGWDIPVVTFVTDPFTAPPHWFKKKQKKFVVFSKRLHDYCAMRIGIPQDKLHVFPFALDQKFSSPLSSFEIEQIKIHYGFSLDKKIVLIIGGGDGIPHGKSILHHLLSASLQVEIAIVCGKNKELYNTAIAYQRHNPNIKVFAFVDFVYELINASDIVITKCGASTIMEILLMKKIPIINNYIWEQELGNMEFVRDNKLGIFDRNISNLLVIIKTLTSDTNAYNQYVHNINAMNLRNGTQEVAEYLVHL